MKIKNDFLNLKNVPIEFHSLKILVRKIKINSKLIQKEILNSRNRVKFTPLELGEGKFSYFLKSEFVYLFINLFLNDSEIGMFFHIEISFSDRNNCYFLYLFIFSLYSETVVYCFNDSFNCFWNNNTININEICHRSFGRTFVCIVATFHAKHKIIFVIIFFHIRTRFPSYIRIESRGISKRIIEKNLVFFSSESQSQQLKIESKTN